MQSRTTLSGMSKVLNLSISTVSKSLSDSSEISKLTKKRVQDFALQCNYIPNSFAASLRKGYTNTIGLIIPNILNPFYANVLLGIEKYLDKNDYKLITSISNESRHKESRSLKNLTSGYVDGLIICASRETEVMSRYNDVMTLIEQDTPVVMFDRTSERINCDKVVINDYKISFDATEYLIKKRGCKNIIMTSQISKLGHGKLRAEGFKAALKKYNISHESRILALDDPHELKHKLTDLIKNDPNIDGIFAANEMAVIQSTSVSNLLTLNNLNKNIVIVGFCSQLQSEYNPSLIAINQHPEKIGIETAKLILKRIKSENKENYITRTVSANII